MLSTFISIWFVLYYTLTSKKRGVYCLSPSILPSVLPSETNIFIIFFSGITDDNLMICGVQLELVVPYCTDLPFHTCTYILTFWNFVNFFVTFFSGYTDDSHVMVFCMQPQLGVLYHAYLFRICSTPIFC